VTKAHLGSFISLLYGFKHCLANPQRREHDGAAAISKKKSIVPAKSRGK
jgi:hypothetical protein